MTKRAIGAGIAVLCSGLTLAAVSPLLHLGGTAAYAQTQAEMNIQSGDTYKQADAEMSAAYWKLYNSISKPQQAMLKESQRIWLKYRDATARLRASPVSGGSIYPTIYAKYLTELTKNHTAELQAVDKSLHAEGGF